MYKLCLPLLHSTILTWMLFQFSNGLFQSISVEALFALNSHKNPAMGNAEHTNFFKLKGCFFTRKCFASRWYTLRNERWEVRYERWEMRDERSDMREEKERERETERSLSSFTGIPRSSMSDKSFASLVQSSLVCGSVSQFGLQPLPVFLVEIPHAAVFTILGTNSNQTEKETSRIRNDLEALLHFKHVQRFLSCKM